MDEDDKGNFNGNMYGVKYRSANEMKESGIEWLGLIPKIWSTKKTKYITSCYPSTVDKKSYPSENSIKLCNYTDVYYNYYITKDLVFIEATATKSQIRKFGIKKNDILITKDSETPDDIGIASFVKEDVPNLLCGYHLSMIRSIAKQEPLFLYFQLRSIGIRNYFETRANGVTRYGIGNDGFRNLLLATSSTAEERKIANFLDIKTAQFESIIAKKEQLIKKLEDAKKALISEVVTGKVKIIDGKLVARQPDELKGSGIEWIGMIPRDWEIKKIKNIAYMKSGDFITADDIENEGTYPVFGGNGLRGYTKLFNTNGYKVLIGRQGALCGNVNYADGKYWASEHAIVVNKVNGTSIKWFGELLRIMNLNQYSVTAAQPGISVGMINNLYVPCPTSNDQYQISEYLSNYLSSFSQIINYILEQIQLLKSAKQSLISEAVTGKIDLQDWKIIEQEGAS